MSYKFLSTILGIDANFTGLVGIGTTSPYRKLTINNSTNALIGFQNPSYNSSTIGSDNIGSFIVYDDTASAYRLVIKPNGYAGIGNTTPNYKLDVLGIIRFSDSSTASYNGGFVESTSTNVYVGGLGIENINLYTGGVTALYVSGSSKNVLIGTTTDAGYKLDVNGTGRFANKLSVGSSSNTGQNAITAVNNDAAQATFYSYNYNASGWSVYSAQGINYFANNVGIGTTSPSQKLQVGDGTGTGNQYIRLYSSSSDIYIGQSGGGLFGLSANAAANIVQDNSSYPLAIGTTFSQPLIFGTTNAERMRIASNGFVGIGVNNPLNQLVLPNNQYLAWKNSVGIESVGISTDSSNSLIFFNVSERMRIASSGNVLIGTTTDAGYKLDVNGTGRFSNTLYANSNIVFSGFIQPSSNVGYGVKSANGTVLQEWYDGSTYNYGTLVNSGNINAGNTSSGAQINVYASSYGNNGLFNAYGTDNAIKLQMGALGTNEGFLYTGASNKLTFYSGGSLSLTLASSGAATLNSLSGSGTRMVVADGSGTLSTQSIPTGTVTGSGTTNYVSKWSSSSSLTNSLLYDDGTNVGIGTTSPVAKLHINNASSAATNFLAGNNSGGTYFGWDSDNTGLISTYATAPIKFGNNYAGSFYETMRIATNGYVGIGTASPSNTLTVISPDYTTVRSQNSWSSNYFTLSNTNGTYSASVFSIINDLAFATSNSAIERMRITNAGNLLIGTTTDNGAKLQVVGGAISLNQSGQNILFANNIASGTSGYNIFIGNGGVSITGSGGEGSYNASLGYDALRYTTTGSNNTAVGAQSMRDNSTGYNNAAFGMNSLLSNSSGYFNVAVGKDTLFYNTSGYQNTAIGSSAMFSNTTGLQNTAVGRSALLSNTTGNYSVAVGVNALLYNNGDDNVALGSASMYSNTSGRYNLAAGSIALYNNTTGDSNVALGFASLYTNTTGTQNTAVGRNALNSNTTASYNTAVGFQSLNSNTTGEQNTAVGRNSLLSNTAGNYNSAFGLNALIYNTTGGFNTGLGFNALNNNTTADYNTGIGSYALFNNSIGNANTSIGYQSMQNNVSGNYNTAIGYGSLIDANNNRNTAVGFLSLAAITSGSLNTAIGMYSGYYSVSGSGYSSTNTNSVFLGYQAKSSTDGNTNEIVIGFDADGQGSNSAVLGNSSITKTVLRGNVLIGTTTDAGYKLRVNGNTYIDGVTGMYGKLYWTNSYVAGTPFDFIQSTYAGGAYCGIKFTAYNPFNGLDSGLGFQVMDSSGNYVQPLYISGINNNVGIGTTSPTGKLEVRGNRTNSKDLLLNLSKYDYGSTYFYQNYSNTFYTNGKSLEIEIETLPLLQLAVNNAGSAGKVIFPNGNVGIGTTSPSYKLQVIGDAYGLYVIGANSSPYTQTIASFVYGGNSNSINIENQGGKASFQARDSSTSPMALHLNPIGGNVLINTTTDVGIKLYVVGGIRANGGNGQVDVDPTSGAFRFYDGSTFRGGFGTDAWANGGSASDLTTFLNGGNYYIYNGPTNTKALTVLANSNVGIGVTNPDRLLVVNGKGRFQNVGITGTPYWNNNSFELQSQGGQTIALEFHRGGYSSATIFSDDGSLAFNTNSGVERMRIVVSTGNVLIGTTFDAGYKLNVNGDGRFNGSVITTSAVTTNQTGGQLAYQGSSVTLLGAWGANSSTRGILSFYLTDSNGTIGNEYARLTDSSYYVVPTTTLNSLSGSGTRMVVADSSGTLSTQAIPGGVVKAYGSWQTNSTQTSPANNFPTPIYYNTVDFNNNVIIDNDSALQYTLIKMQVDGKFNIQFSAQFQNTDSQIQDVTIWLRKNGESTPFDVANSAGLVSIPNSHGGAPGTVIAAWNYFVDASAGDFFQLVWQTTLASRVTMQYYTPGNPPPGAASIILTVNKID